jgi:hypothetical protein
MNYVALAAAGAKAGLTLSHTLAAGQRAEIGLARRGHI